MIFIMSFPFESDKSDKCMNSDFYGETYYGEIQVARKLTKKVFRQY